MHFITKSKPSVGMKTGYDGKIIPNICQTEFLGITVDSTLSWRIHIGQLMSKLSTASYIIRSVKPSVSHTALIMIYYFLFRSLMNYGLMFWENPSYSLSD
jgi:hypothetical protein